MFVFFLLARPSRSASNFLSEYIVCVWFICFSMFPRHHLIFVSFYFIFIYFKFTKKIVVDGFLFRSKFHGCIDVCMFANFIFISFFAFFFSFLKFDLFNWQKRQWSSQMNVCVCFCLCLCICLSVLITEKIFCFVLFCFFFWIGTQTMWTFFGGICFLCWRRDAKNCK